MKGDEILSLNTKTKKTTFWKMQNIKKISTIVRKGFDPATVQGSLHQYGLTRFPKTIHRQGPYRDIDNRFRTGLDENALYIRNMKEDVEREQEKQRVRGYLEMAQEMYGPEVDLSPNSAFYKNLYPDADSTAVHCEVAKLKDGDNIFNLHKIEDLIKYAYLRVHPDIAPSMATVNSGNYTRAKYYVNDEEQEDDTAFKKKTKINKAIGILDTLTAEKKKRIGRQLGLAFTDSSTEASVYNRLDEYIKSSESTKGTSNVDRFLTISEMKDENLVIRDVIEQALMYGILREDIRTRQIKRGKNSFADDKEAAILFLTDPNNDQELTIIEDELKLKKSQKK